MLLKPTLTAGLCAVLLAACAGLNFDSTAKSGLRFNSVEILNLSRDDIFNMKIEVTRFHRVFICGIILHRSMCMNGFHERVLEGNEIVITWEQEGVRHKVGPFKVEAPEEFDSSLVYAVRFIVDENRQFNYQFGPSTY